MNMFRSLRFHNYRLLWITVALTNAASWAFQLAMGWQVFALTSSSFWVGASVFATLMPYLIGAPIAGVLADKMERRHLMVFSILFAVVCTVLLAVLGFSRLSSSVGLLITLTFFLGLASSLMGIGMNSILPNMVPRENLYNAVSLQGVAQRGTECIGPALSGPLIAWYGVKGVFVLCAILYILAVIFAWLIRPVAQSREGAGKKFFSSIREGLGYIRQVKEVAIIIITVGLHCSLTMSYMGILPEFIKVEMHLQANFYAILMSMIGLGAMLGALLLAAVNNRRARGELFWLTALFSGISLVMLGISHGQAALVAAAFGVGLTQTMFMILSLAYIQDTVADRVRGRVTSVYFFLAAGIMSVANWVYGAWTSVVPPHLLLIGLGVLFAIAVGVLIAVSRSFRTVCWGAKRPQAQPIAPPAHPL